ncbi:MAG: hypothetical protein RLN78_09440 [Phycisphaerales bacterium]
MNLQSIIGFFTSPLGFIIIVGAFSTLGRVIKSAQEQQAKKRAIAMRKQADQDSLRTGARAADSQSTSTVPIAQSTKADKDTSWDNKQQLRRDRIEQLRKQRVDQLKKLREQRSGGASTAAAQSSTPTASPRQQPVTQSSTQRLTQPPRRTTPNRPSIQSQQSTTRPSRVQQLSNPKPIVNQSAPRKRARTPIAQQQVDESRRIARSAIKAKTDTPITDGSVTNNQIGSETSIRTMIRSDFKRAMIAKEVLSQPIGLRSPDANPMGDF